MRYVARVVSSVKKSCDLTLGPKTLIVGPNGSGKTTLVQSLELATIGCASDLEGRDLVQQQGSLARLFPEDTTPRAECWLNDGTHFQWEMKPKAGVGAEGYHEPTHEAPVQVAWPLRDIQSILLGDSSKLARWLEDQVLGPAAIEEVLAQLPPEVRNEVSLLSRKGKTSDIMELASLAKNEARTLRLNATKVEKTIEQMVQGIPAPLTDQELAALKEQLQLGEMPPGTVTQAQMDTWKVEKQTLIEQSFQLEKEKETIPQVSAKLFASIDRLQKAKRLVAQHKEHFPDAAACFVCGQGNPAQMASFAVELDKLVATVSASVNQADLQRRQALTNQQASFLEKLKQLEHLISTSRVASPPPSNLNAIRSRIASNEVAVRAWANHAAKSREITRDRVRADQFTTASKTLSTVGKEILQRKKADFEAKVNQYLPKADTFSIDLHAARVGLVRNGHLHTALSGAEYSRVLLALAACSADPDAINILSPPDRAWDANTLAVVMTAMCQTQAQVILMSTIEPAFVPADWTVIKLWT